MKLKIAFVSADFFADVDMSVMVELSVSYELTWYCVMKERARYSKDVLNEFAKKHNIHLKIILLKGRRRSLRNLGTYLNLYKNLKFSSYHLIYFEYIQDPYSFVLSLWISRSKKIFGIHDVLLHSNFCSLSNRILHDLIPLSFKYIQVFSSTQRELLRLNYHKRNSFVIPLSKKNSGVVNTCRPNIEDGLRLLFFGGIHSYKRLDILIQAMEMLSDGVNVSLTIAGKGPDWENVKGLIKNTSMYNLNIGFVPADSIPDLFNSHHFIVLPYQDVTQSGPLFDAFNFSLPAVVSDQPGFLEFIENGKTGFLFETNSVDNLSAIIKKLCSLNQDDYDIVLKNLNRFSEKYEPKNIAVKYSDMFSTVLNSK